MKSAIGEDADATKAENTTVLATWTALGNNDPEYPDNLFARSEWRNGIFNIIKH